MQPLVVKIGGAALEDAALVERLAGDVAWLKAMGCGVALVHGGGPQVNRELTARGITWSFVEGQRVTTPEMMGVIEQVLSGVVNRRLVRALGAQGVLAAGFSGVDARLLGCVQMDPRLGQVGRIEHVNAAFLNGVISGLKTVPVIAPLGVGSEGEAYNINADWAAARIAEALRCRRVIFATDQDGIWDADRTVVGEIDSLGLQGLIDSGAVQGGMLAKVRTILHLLEHGAEQVYVVNARRPRALIDIMSGAAAGKAVGTVCKPFRPLIEATHPMGALHA